MTFDEIFTAYYSLFRAEADTPTSDDDEYTVALRFANEAINRWANYDATYWKELWTHNQSDDSDGDQTITSGTATYGAPSDMREAGGSVKIQDSNGNTVYRFPIIEPQEAQFKGDDGKYAYFTGNPSGTGFTLNLNPAPDSTIDGKSIEYDYYKKPTLFEDGDSTTEVPDSYFIINRALAQRFRASRNYSAYQIAFRDAEDALKIMKLDNDSGSWANPWKLSDNSGSTWGE